MSTNGVGERIRIIRHNLGLAQKEVARLAKISGSHLSRIEHGHYDPKATTLRRIASAMGVDLQTLFSPVQERERELTEAERLRRSKEKPIR